MAVISWHPDFGYCLSLGCQDKLQDAILKIKEMSGLEPNASPDEIQGFILCSSIAMADLDFLKYILHKFFDIYSQKALGLNYTIDHFLPWGFVVHDMLWNLTPVEKSTISYNKVILPILPSIYLVWPISISMP
ncbi:MAG: HNH endonuclease domain-containing protein [bacterium]